MSAPDDPGLPRGRRPGRVRPEHPAGGPGGKLSEPHREAGSTGSGTRRSGAHLKRIPATTPMRPCSSALGRRSGPLPAQETRHPRGGPGHGGLGSGHRAVPGRCGIRLRSPRLARRRRRLAAVRPVRPRPGMAGRRARTCPRRSWSRCARRWPWRRHAPSRSLVAAHPRVRGRNAAAPYGSCGLAASVQGVPDENLTEQARARKVGARRKFPPPARPPRPGRAAARHLRALPDHADRSRSG